jgi:hypothetical protein
MHSSNKKLLAAIGLIAATLGLSSAYPSRTVRQSSSEGNTFVRVSDSWQPDGFEAEMKDGKLVGMRGTRNDGSRVALKPHSKPTCNQSCPAGQKLSCWEDEEEKMSICVCVPVGGGGASLLNRTTGAIA